MTVIIIDGNIGSGKSTIIEKLKKDNFLTKSEKLNNFEPWIQLYYKNMKKYALGFQLEVLMSHMKNKYLVKDKSLTVLERSPLSCLYIFGKHLLEKNILSQLEHDLCIRVNEEYGWIPKNIIYLQTSPEIAYQRVINRNRSGENNISKEYLISLNNYYNKLYGRNIEYNIHIINADRNIDLVYNDVKKIIKDYDIFLTNIINL
jgi:deoxyadenosine/deoxycytidine kinase